MQIRQGNPEDLAAVKALGIVVWSRFRSELTADNWELMYQTISSDQRYIELLRLDDSFICEDEAGEIIGFSFLVPSGHPTELFNEQQASIRYVTVSPEHGGKGLGQLLTQACIDRAKANGERYLALHTSEMMAPARHIYEKLGFRIAREIEPRLGKRYWIYELSL